MLLLAGCALGERPYFEESPTVVGTSTGDDAIDAVLDLLDGVGDATFTATYQVTLRFGGKVSAATITQVGTRRSVTIGQLRFVIDGVGNRTCALDTGVCEDGVQAARVSDTGLTPDFASGDMAKRLRRDATARIATSVVSQAEIAGQTATCVDVSVSGGTKQYCALADGAIARFVGADIDLQLISYLPSADETLFTP
jgi:hypothetical protein